MQIEKCATNAQWLDDGLARQAERPKNVKPIIASADILKRRDDTVFTCAAIMNRPKPRAPKAPTTETPAQEAEEPKEEKEEGGPTVEEMDVD